MKIKDILKNIDIVDTNRKIDMEREIDSLSYHTDTVTENGAFVAVKGYVTDGHKYIPVAVNKGASLVIVEDFTDDDVDEIKVGNSRIALADIANNFYKEPSKELNITGITATNGKTTTSFMLDKIYKDAGFNTGLIGTVYTKYEDVVIPSILTTPESAELQRILRDMADRKIEKVTMEVSSSSQQEYRVKNIIYDIVTFNNFSREHIDEHGTFEKYYEEKSKLIRNASSNAVAILNVDFDKIRDLKDKTKSSVLTYSLENNSEDFAISDLDLSTGKGKFIFHINNDIEYKNVKISKGSFNVELTVAGYSSVMNSVVAIIVALLNGVSIENIQKSLFEFTGVERRFELIYDEKFQIIDDHYANIRNIDVTLDTLSKMDYKDFHMLYAIRGSRGVNLNRETAELTANWLKKLNYKTFYATLSKDTVKRKDTVTSDELEIFKKVMNDNNINYKIFETLEDGVKEIVKVARDNDVVLLAGCQGMDKGASFAVEQLLEDNLSENPEELKDRISQRIC